MLYVVYTYRPYYLALLCVRSFFSFHCCCLLFFEFFHLIPNKTRRGRRTKEENTDCTVCAERFIQAKMMNLPQTLYHNYYIMRPVGIMLYSRLSLSLSLLIYVSITIAIRMSNISSGASIHHRLIGVCVAYRLFSFFFSWNPVLGQTL